MTVWVESRASCTRDRIHGASGLITRRAMSSSLHYSGHLYFRHRLVLSILSGKSIKIDKIRPGDKNPGLCGALSLLRAECHLRIYTQTMKSAYCD